MIPVTCQRSAVGERSPCLKKPPWEMSQLKGRSLPCSHTAQQGELKEGLLKLSCLWNGVVGSQSNCMWWERCAWDSLYPQLSLLLDKWVLEKLPAIHVLIAWLIFQGHMHQCSPCHSAPLWVFQRTDWNQRSSWPSYSSGICILWSLYQATDSLVKGSSAFITQGFMKSCIYSHPFLPSPLEDWVGPSCDRRKILWN